jgi:hypothetical protein
LNRKTSSIQIANIIKLSSAESSAKQAWATDCFHSQQRLKGSSCHEAAVLYTLHVCSQFCRCTAEAKLLAAMAAKKKLKY